MPRIENIVDEIYGVLLNPKGLEDTDIKRLGEAIASSLLNKIESHRDQETKFSLRISNYGQNPRKLWFDANYPQDRDKTFTGADLLKFLIGDITEEVILYMAEKAGYIVEHRQTEVEFEGIPGHPDAVINGVLVDVKSASSYAFKNKFKTGNIFRGDDGFGYVSQLGAYGEALGVQDKAFLAWNKESGELAYIPVPYSSKSDFKATAANAKAVVKQDKPPEDKCFAPEPKGKSGNEVLAKPCTWCPHKFNCWKDANNGQGLITHEYSTGTEYFTTIEKPPRTKAGE